MRQPSVEPALYDKDGEGHLSQCVESQDDVRVRIYPAGTTSSVFALMRAASDRTSLNLTTLLATTDE